MLVLKNITKEYASGEEKLMALKGISFCFRKSEFVSILGPSGCGKTTTLNIIGGLDRYTDGDLVINGKSTKDFTDSDWDTYRNHSVGFVFQSYNLIPHQTILANVELALTLSGVGPKERKERAVKALEQVGLGAHVNKRPSQLSGGQMQRVAIARALINDPEILLADEPTGALDSETSVQIMNILKEISKDRLIIMVTHNPELAEEYSNRIIRFADGVVVDDTNPFSEDAEAKEIEALASEKQQQNKGKSGMSFKTALSLSLQNLMTKRARTILTAFAGSIGIIGIALILALSTGIQNYIDRIQEETMLSIPITVEQQALDTDALMSSMTGIGQEMMNTEREKDGIYVNTAMKEMIKAFLAEASVNNLTSFRQYIEDNREVFDELCNEITYNYGTVLNIYKADTSNGIVKVNPTTFMDSASAMAGGMPSGMSGSSMMSMNMWTQLIGDEELMDMQYDLVAGKFPTDKTEVVLIVDPTYSINEFVQYALGLKDMANFSKELMKVFSEAETDTPVEQIKYSFDEILDMRFRLVLNSDCFVYNEQTGYWDDFRENNLFLRDEINNGLELKIVGILCPDEDLTLAGSPGGIGFTSDLMDWAINETANSEVVKQQLAQPDINILTGTEFANTNLSDLRLADIDFSKIDMNKLDITPFMSMMADMDMESMDMTDMTDMSSVMDFSTITPLMQTMMEKFLTEEQANAIKKAYLESVASDDTYSSNLAKMGYANVLTPTSVYLYPKDFATKAKLEEVIDYYNEQVEALGFDSYTIQVTDFIGILLDSVTTILNIVTYVLVAFVAISLVVSSIMIGIITYISVLERTKEIGILRSIGASKKDVSRVFNAETIIVGLASGCLGIGVTLLLEIPINLVLKYLTTVKAAASLSPVAAIVLIGISVLLSFIAGLIPSGLAAKKDPVEALRTD
ncbi:MAG: ABC transporter ATP-binding protein/permease [Ruminococcaceae bacterium]|nr:ABC transporter ATP-binding protein/permease [Oscillospiraceae bacterium]